MPALKYYDGSTWQFLSQVGPQGPTGDTGATGATGPQGASVYFVELFVSDPNGATLTTGNGKVYWTVPALLNGFKVTAVHISVTTTSSSGLPTAGLRNVTQSLDILSTSASIDVSELTSYTAATAPVVNTSNNTLATGDQVRVDVSIAGTGTKGLTMLITLTAP